MIELERVFVSKKVFGKYTSTLEWYVKNDVWIDNCFKSTITDKAGNIIDIIDKIRPIPEKIKPDHIVPPPIEGEPPIDGTGKLWYFDPEYRSDMYLFEPVLEKPTTAWVIKVVFTSSVFDAETGKYIGKSNAPSKEHYEQVAERIFGKDFDIYRTGIKPIKTKIPSHYKFGTVDLNNVAPAMLKIWFKMMGATVIWKEFTTSAVQSIITDSSVQFFYCHAHGNPSSCDLYTAKQVEQWMGGRQPMRLAILNHCNVMDNTGPGTLSHVFRKGSMKGAATVGLIGPERYISIDWVSKFLFYIVGGEILKDAFDHARAAIPYATYGFYGDQNMKLAGEEVAPTKKTITFKSVPRDASVTIGRG